METLQINTQNQSTLQLNIPNDLVQMFGLTALQTYMQKRLELLKMQLLADKIGKGIAESGMDWEQELKNARQEAWNDYKQLKNNQ